MFTKYYSYKRVVFIISGMAISSLLFATTGASAESKSKHKGPAKQATYIFTATLKYVDLDYSTLGVEEINAKNKAARTSLQPKKHRKKNKKPVKLGDIVLKVSNATKIFDVNGLITLTDVDDNSYSVGQLKLTFINKAGMTVKALLKTPLNQVYVTYTDDTGTPDDCAPVDSKDTCVPDGTE